MSEQKALAFLQGGGEMGERMRSHAWDSTPVGPAETWPSSLKSAVSTLLQCQLPMYIAWGDQFIQFYNDAYRPILGDKHPAALGHSAPITWSEIWPTIGPMWQDVLAGNPVGFDNFKLTIERFGYPEDCYFNFSYSPVLDDNGVAAGVLVTFAETTRLVKNERRLALFEELAQQTRELSDPSAVMQVSARLLGQHLGVNRCAYAHVHEDQDTFDLLGDYNDEVDSIVGRYRFADFGQVVHDLMLRDLPYVNPDVDTDPATQGTDLTAYRNTQIQAVICVPLHKNGRFVAAMAVHQATPRRWTETDVELVRTIADRCWESLERLRSAAALREEAELLEILNQTGSALSAELDLESLLQQVTDAATRLTGAQFGSFFYNGVDAQGEAYLLYTLCGAPKEAFSRLGHPRPTDLFGPTFKGGPPIRVDDILEDPRYGQWAPHRGMPSGHLPVRSYLAVPVTSRTGEVIGGLFFGHSKTGVFTARSERMAVGVAGQAATAIDNARLYASAQAATKQRDLLLESERSARQEVERVGKVKDEFLATLSHELRTPLSAILGWVHILRRKLPAQLGDLQRGVDVIERSTRVQVQLIEDLLDMSRITSGKIALETSAIAPASFVEAALEVIRPSAQAAGVELIAELEPTDVVLGDPARLQQVVWNLLANAVKFTPRGGAVRILLSQQGDSIAIRVTDNGVGIAPDVLPHIFERFRQADGSITRRFGGLGLGLSIVRHLVQLHGGAVEAQSQGEGHGATFTVTLPALDRGREMVAEAIRTTAEDNALSGLRVLIVDDEADARDLLQRVLSDFGAQVTEAASAQQALDLFVQARPDILVSDIGMPGMDGLELIRQVRKLPADTGANVPAIALTAFARPEDRGRALDAGFTEHMAKPIEPHLLVRRVQVLCGSRPDAVKLC